MNIQEFRENVFSDFINNEDFCSTENGKKIERCEKIKEMLKKDLSRKQCTSCVRSAIYSKYRQIIYAKLIKAGK
jgi:hypothetical protein